jgi:hypothetical protein
MSVAFARIWKVLGSLFVLLLLTPSGAAAQITPMSVPDLPATIPLFPLTNVAVLPFSELPLRVFEPRYKSMLADALASNRVIGIVQQQPNLGPENIDRPPIFTVGSAVVVVRVEPLPNGDSSIVVRAFTRFRLVEELVTADTPYRTARVEALPELADDAEREQLRMERPALEAALATSLGVGGGSLRLPPMSDEALVNLLVMNMDFDVLDRQMLLEQPGVLARARKLVELLASPASRAIPR